MDATREKLREFEAEILRNRNVSANDFLTQLVKLCRHYSQQCSVLEMVGILESVSHHLKNKIYKP